MRNMAELSCPRCAREFYGDLPAGHGFSYPMLLDRESGAVHDPNGVFWFGDWLGESYGKRIDQPLSIEWELLRPLRRVVLLNCLDRLYGHSLLKLLNAQYYIDKMKDWDLVVLTPAFLRWLVPEGVAAVLTIDLPLSRGGEWNDWLGRELKRRVGQLPECHLSVALPHPHPLDFNIERFTRIVPFPIEEWAERVGERPTVAFIWREDRRWSGQRQTLLPEGGKIWRRLRSDGSGGGHAQQNRAVAALAGALRGEFPNLEFAVIGLGWAGDMPKWVLDLRTETIDREREVEWCRRYAKCHVVVGVHGSNMLLPSACAGSVVELVPTERWGNLGQDVLPATADAREWLARSRFLPLDCSSETVAAVIAALLRSLPFMLLNFGREWTDHQNAMTNPGRFSEQRRMLRRKTCRGSVAKSA
jgi:hypothetical protein